MQNAHPADLTGCDIYIGYLEGHPDDKREIHKIKIIRLVLAGKLQAAKSHILAVDIRVRIIIQLGIPQCINGMQQKPRYNNSAYRQQNMFVFCSFR